MTASEIGLWMGMGLAAFACVAAVRIAYLAVMRWLVVLVPVIIGVGFALETQAQLRFTAALLGTLAILYLPPLLGAWVWRRAARRRRSLRAEIASPSAMERAHHGFADEEARISADRQARATRDAREQADREARARDLERQGAFSLWTRP